jgi:epoxyqueuosine reductase QueG
MGPELTKAAKAGGFDGAAWSAAQKAADQRDFDQTVAALAAQEQTYAQLLGDMSDADFRAEMSSFDGRPISKGSFIVNLVLSGHAAYRTQLFLYLKACGRDELSTWNLWQGKDAPAPANV